jgi:hypothetical protein
VLSNHQERKGKLEQDSLYMLSTLVSCELFLDSDLNESERTVKCSCSHKLSSAG